MSILQKKILLYLFTITGIIASVAIASVSFSVLFMSIFEIVSNITQLDIQKTSVNVIMFFMSILCMVLSMTTTFKLTEKFYKQSIYDLKSLIETKIVKK
jgi:hypothetical protein